ncbi:MAG: fibronectin type III domain-containing protein, partial [Patescibacteria group bacterium]
WEGDGTKKLERKEEDGDFVAIVETENNFYIDFQIKSGRRYSYRLGDEVREASEGTSGTPVIQDIKIEQGMTSQSESSVIVSFKTDTLSKAKVNYGESASYGQEIGAGDDLNQSHTLLIERLKPNTTYHFRLSASSQDASSESDDQVFATERPPVDESVLEVILHALQQAFSGFEDWINN